MSYFPFQIVFFIQTSQAGSKDKKTDQPPQAKKAKVKTTTVDLPIDNQLLWQREKDMLNLFIENEVSISLNRRFYKGRTELICLKLE